MLLSLYPLLITRYYGHSGGTLIDPDVTHREIRSREIIKRTPAMLAAEEHLKRLQGVGNGASITGTDDTRMGVGSIPASHQPAGDATIRVPRYVRTTAERMPISFVGGATTSIIAQHRIDTAMMRRDEEMHAMNEDEELALTIILGRII